MGRTKDRLGGIFVFAHLDLPVAGLALCSAPSTVKSILEHFIQKDKLGILEDSHEVRGTR